MLTLAYILALITEIILLSGVICLANMVTVENTNDLVANIFNIIGVALVACTVGLMIITVVALIGTLV